MLDQIVSTLKVRPSRLGGVMVPDLEVGGEDGRGAVHARRT